MVGRSAACCVSQAATRSPLMSESLTGRSAASGPGCVSPLGLAVAAAIVIPVGATQAGIATLSQPTPEAWQFVATVAMQVAN